MYLLELFQKVAKWEWVDRYNATFDIGDNSYDVLFYGFPTGQTGVGFGLVDPESGLWREGDTGTGNEFLVFSTVVDILKDYASRNKPEYVIIPAKAERERLYTRMINRIAPDIGYELHDKAAGQFMHYGKVVFLEIVRKDLQPK